MYVLKLKISPYFVRTIQLEYWTLNYNGQESAKYTYSLLQWVDYE